MENEHEIRYIFVNELRGLTLALNNGLVLLKIQQYMKLCEIKTTFRTYYLSNYY